MQHHRTFRPGTLAAAACVLAAGVILAGCRSEAQTGALFDTGVGAGLGAIIGHQSGHAGEGALLGAGIGALGGYVVGNEGDKEHHWRHHPSQHHYHSNYDY